MPLSTPFSPASSPPPRRRRADPINPLGHRCTLCGYEWESVSERIAKGVRQAAKVNSCGPYCELCRNLVMAYRVAELRGISLTEAVAERQSKFARAGDGTASAI